MEARYHLKDIFRGDFNLLELNQGFRFLTITQLFKLTISGFKLFKHLQVSEIETILYPV